MGIALLSMKSDGGKKDLLCHRWIQFAFKKNISSEIQPVDKSMTDDITFKPDGTYSELTYGGQMKTAGYWYINDDETKMEFMVLNLNGTDVPPFPEKTRHFNVIILKITADTLIYGHEFYTSKNNGPQVYDHSDLYFIRKN
jgi:hypothetical protein